MSDQVTFTAKTRTALYGEVSKQILAVVEGETNTVSKMASVSSLLNQAFDDFFWTGFYIVDPLKPTELVVGPYQGTLGCLRIPFGRGVCGVAATTKTTQIVDDVHAFPGHIACDENSKSEIVVPVMDKDGHLIAVLDVDSDKLSSFNHVDKIALETLMAKVFAL
jgi:GAF domain-containing protein